MTDTDFENTDTPNDTTEIKDARLLEKAPDRAVRFLSFDEEVKYELWKSDLPEGYTAQDMEKLLGYIHLWWLTEDNRPTLSQLVTLSGWSESKLVRGLRSRAAYYRLRKRGIDWPENWSPEASRLTELTPQQVMVLQILTDPTRTEPFRKRLTIAGINYNIFRNWMRNPKFSGAYKAIGESMVTDNIATVHTALVQKAERGDTNAMKLFYEVSGRHDPMRQQTQDLSKLVGILLEIITRHITDVGVLNRINNDFTRALSGDNVSPVGELEAHRPADIEDAEIVEDEPPAVADGFFEL